MSRTPPPLSSTCTCSTKRVWRTPPPHVSNSILLRYYSRDDHDRERGYSQVRAKVFTKWLENLHNKKREFMSRSTSWWDSHFHSCVLTIYIRLYSLWELLVFTILYVGVTYTRLVYSWYQNIFHQFRVHVLGSKILFWINWNIPIHAGESGACIDFLFFWFKCKK